MAAIAATFVNDALDFFLVLAGAFLDASDQFVFLAIHELQVVVRELRKFLFQPAFGDVPVAFHFQCVHKRFVGVDGFVASVAARVVRLFCKTCAMKNSVSFRYMDF